ncbi:MAG: right-handed parallel beta-helix repeat-containing protein, partial [Bacteroidales bacterium]
QALRGNLSNGIVVNNNDCLIKNNKIHKIGYCGIKLSSTADIITIQNNYLDSILLILNDGGGIYTAAEGISRKIEGNIITNVIGNMSGTPYPDRPIARGIYLDVNSTNVIITGNTVANCSESGYMIHRAHDNRLENNIAFNNGNGMFFQNSSGSNIRNNVLSNNIFFAKTSDQNALKFSSIADDIPSFGTADNNYYARPVDDDDVFHTYSPSTGNKNRTLAGWQSFTSQDRNSKKSPVTVSDTSKIDFYYNPTTANKAITLAQPMVDIKGVKYTGTFTLLPYTSVILMPDPNPYVPATPVFSGASIENSAPAALIINYSLSLASIVPAVTAFIVKVNGTNRTINTVTISGSKVTLTLASQVIYGDAVTVSYTMPSSNPLQTSEGARAVSLISQTVKNNCVAPNPTPDPTPTTPPSQPPVQQNQPPAISIASPVKGSSYTSPATVVIDVVAHDPDGSISSVALYNGNVILGVLTAAPYTFTLKELKEGSFSLHAEATDNLNLTAKSASLEFHVTPFFETEPSFSLYPNPNDGHFTIDFSTVQEAGNLKMAVHSMIGRTVYQTDLTGDDYTRQFDLSHLNPGIYVIMISANEIIQTQKFIKR